MKIWTYQELWTSGLLPHEEYEYKIRDYFKKIQGLIIGAIQ